MMAAIKSESDRQPLTAYPQASKKPAQRRILDGGLNLIIFTKKQRIHNKIIGTIKKPFHIKMVDR